MVKYTCPNCEKEFAQKGHFTKHQQRKTPCKKDVRIEEKVREIVTSMKPGLKFIDLFCGIGGFHQALTKLGAHCVLACDIDAKCREVYHKNYGIMPYDDVTTLDPSKMPDFDIICGGFPCFVEGTRVLTNSGYKEIQTVTLEDKLLTHTGQFKSILNLQRKIYDDKLYSIKIKYHPEPIICTSEHPFYVREKSKKWNSNDKKYDVTFGSPVWKDAKDLTMDDYYGMIINTKNEIPTFTYTKIINSSLKQDVSLKLDNPDQWYMMGYFLGDGWIQDDKKADGRTRYLIRFAIGNKNEEYIVNKLRKILPITDKKTDSGKCKKFGCSNQQWYIILKEFGNYAHGKKIPEWVQDAPVHLIREFIDGYVDADGFRSKKKIVATTTVSRDIAFGIQRLYLKLGKIAIINKTIRKPTCVIDGRTVNQKNTYTTRVYNTNPYSSFIDGEYVWFAPSKLTSYYTENTPVYNFEVETDNSYVVDNTIVHNCQPFSNGGHKKSFEDKRGRLFDEIIRIAEAKKPRFMFLENVKHIKKISDGRVFKYILEELARIGYSVTVSEISPHNLGIPQQRERIIFTCIRNDIAKPVVIPIPDIPCDFEKILDKSPDPKYRISDSVNKVLEAWDEMVKHVEVGESLSPVILCKEFKSNYTEEEFKNLPDWKQEYITKNRRIYQKYKNEWDSWVERNRNILYQNEVNGKLEWQAGHKVENDSIFNHFIQLRQSGIRVKKAKFFPTLVAIVQIPIYGKERRYLTPRECARLQSFPDSFILHSDDKIAYKQFGNAVNVDVVHYVISTVLSQCN